MRHPAIAFTALTVLAAGLLTLVAMSITGCRAIESGADALANMTAGSAVSDVFRGTARMAEGMRDYSPAEEYYIGRAVSAEILSRFKVLEDPRLQEYVDLVGQSVALSNPDALQPLKGWRFTVLDGAEVNAVSAPGGFVFLTLGTVQRARTEDELAAVLAHEIAHVTLRHGIKSISSATKKKSLALILQGAGRTGAAVAGSQGDADLAQLTELTTTFAGAVQEIAGDLLTKGYSRESELEADTLGAKFLGGTGYPRAALTSYIKRLGSEGGSGGWYGTHPKAEDRLESLAALPADPAQVLTGLAVRTDRFKKVLGG